MPRIVRGGTLYREMTYVLSRYQARPLLDARREAKATAITSLDLGLTTAEAALRSAGVLLPDGTLLAWALVEEIAASETACFAVEDGGTRKVQVFSEETGRVYTLYPTPGAPTMLVSGIPMHRVKGTDPISDTLAKVRAIAPIRGRVLDTATGLGYTAIEAARTADEVVTVEIDLAALEIARRNPWSQQLLGNPKIRQVIGDSFDVVHGLEDASFDIVIHDPPQFSLAGELYSLEFYRQLRRVLKSGGRLFHYIGDPESKMSGNITRGVIRRLAEAGFRNVTRRPEAFGVVARA
jgi:hypothetical protein